MENVVFSMGSVTYAIKARGLLRRAGMDARVVKLDVPLVRGGCTHGLSIRADDTLRAAMLLRQEGIAYEQYPAAR